MQGRKTDNRNQAGKLTMSKKIKVNIFEDLREALRDVRAYERGEDINLRVTHFPAAPKQLTPREIRRIRRKLNASQAVFVQYLNVSANAVRSWEQGTRKLQQAALKLVVIAKKNPKALLTAQRLLGDRIAGNLEQSYFLIFPGISGL